MTKELFSSSYAPSFSPTSLRIIANPKRIAPSVKCAFNEKYISTGFLSACIINVTFTELCPSSFDFCE